MMCILRVHRGLWDILVRPLSSSQYGILDVSVVDTDDDYAAFKLASALGKPEHVKSFLLERAMRAPFTLFNDKTGFMEARNADGTWAGEDNGWTEGV